MGLKIDYISGQTPLDDEELQGLLDKHVFTRQDLDEVEHENVNKASLWLGRSRISQERLLSEKFVKQLHKKMFGNVWSWAGEFRLSDKSIGVSWHQIAVELKKLFDDCRYWIDNKTFSEEEIAVRFKHRLVSIHPFNNGNGRHSRLMADAIMEKIFKKPQFNWGGISLEAENDGRSKYIRALHDADNGNYKSLLEFATSVC